MWFKNMDKLRNYFNANHDKHGINILYSTPSCYLKSLHDTKQDGWPEKKDDFLPYASDPHAYWSGYFTSRPTLKGMIRDANSNLQACKQVHALYGGKDGDPRLDLAKRAVSVNQHHDAVTGTAKQHVTDDYALRLHNGIEACNQIMMETLNSNFSLDLESACPLVNISQCHYSEHFKHSISVTLYNPMSGEVDNYVRLPVSSCTAKYQVLDSDGDIQESQLVPVPREVQSLPGRNSKAVCELVFLATNIPALGYSTFTVEDLQEEQEPPKVFKVASIFTLQNQHLKASFSKTGELKGITLGTTDVKLHQDFAFYRGAVGDNMRY